MTNTKGYTIGTVIALALVFGLLGYKWMVNQGVAPSALSETMGEVWVSGTLSAEAVKEGEVWTLKITDGGTEIPVTFEGILFTPPKEGQTIRALGSYTAATGLVASEVRIDYTPFIMACYLISLVALAGLFLWTVRGLADSEAKLARVLETRRSARK